MLSLLLGSAKFPGSQMIPLKFGPGDIMHERFSLVVFEALLHAKGDGQNDIVSRKLKASVYYKSINLF